MNVCGFHITEFFNEKHPMPDTPDDFVGDGNEGMFAFMKFQFVEQIRNKQQQLGEPHDFTHKQQRV